MTDSKLPENVELLRTRVVVERDRVFSVGFTEKHFEISYKLYIG